MKKAFILLLILLLVGSAYADTDISAMTDKELYALRRAINEEDRKSVV